MIEKQSSNSRNFDISNGLKQTSNRNLDLGIKKPNLIKGEMQWTFVIWKAHKQVSVFAVFFPVWQYTMKNSYEWHIYTSQNCKKAFNFRMDKTTMKSN